MEQTISKDSLDLLIALKSSPVQLGRSGRGAAQILLDFGLAKKREVPHNQNLVDDIGSLFDWQLRITTQGEVFLASIKASKRESARNARRDWRIAIVSALIGAFGLYLVQNIIPCIREFLLKKIGG